MVVVTVVMVGLTLPSIHAPLATHKTHTQRSVGAEAGVMAEVLEKLKQQVSNRRDLKVTNGLMHAPSSRRDAWVLACLHACMQVRGLHADH